MYFSAIIFEILLQLCIDYPQLNWIHVKRFKENKSTGVLFEKEKILNEFKLVYMFLHSTTIVKVFFEIKYDMRINSTIYCICH